MLLHFIYFLVFVIKHFAANGFGLVTIETVLAYIPKWV